MLPGETRCWKHPEVVAHRNQQRTEAYTFDAFSTAGRLISFSLETTVDHAYAITRNNVYLVRRAFQPPATNSFAFPSGSVFGAVVGNLPANTAFAPVKKLIVVRHSAETVASSSTASAGTSGTAAPRFAAPANVTANGIRKSR